MRRWGWWQRRSDNDRRWRRRRRRFRRRNYSSYAMADDAIVLLRVLEIESFLLVRFGDHLVGEDRYSFSDNNNEMQAVTRDAIYKQPKGS